jgi:hypothetical protein
MTPERIEEINKMITANPEWHRSRLSQELCRIWDWRGENGQIKDVSCRDVLRALDAAGKIKLPKRRTNGRLNGSTDKIVRMHHDMTPIEGRLRELRPLAIEIVTGKENIMEFKSYIEQHHYLGYDRSIGENIKYFVNDCYGRRLACFMFGSAAWSCGPRDRYIGWDKELRTTALRYMTNNSRFLIFQWVTVPHLASHALALICRRISDDWVVKYGHPIYMLETFVERDRFRGVCYKAAGWECVGETTGMGRNCRTQTGELPIKDIYVYPLHKRFKEMLSAHNSGINNVGTP